MFSRVVHFTHLMPLGQQQANLWQAIAIVAQRSSERMALIITDRCHKINLHLRYPKCIVLSGGAKRMFTEKLLNLHSLESRIWLCLF